MVSTAAVVVCLVLAALAVFQALLVAGLPIGRFAWGGEHDVLPTNLRIGSAVSIAIYAVTALVVADRAGLISLGGSASVINAATWGFAAFFVLGIIMNLASRSKPERLVMAPMCAVLAALTIIVALG